MHRKTSKKSFESLNKKRKIKTVTATAAIAAAAVLSIIFENQVRGLFTISQLESIYTQSEHFPMSVYFPDAGSAGCAVIHSADGNILIDCGREKAQHDILEMFDFLSISEIDLAILTHPDSDHIGSFREVAENIPISRFMTCEYSKSCGSLLYAELADVLSQHDVNIEYAHAGDVINIGDIKLEIISPDKLYKSSNDNSVVTRLTYGTFTALFTGDISKKAERDILSSGADISAELLCAAHHGSGSSSSEEFLKAVSPKYAVICVEQSEYLPNGGAIERLASAGCEIFRTDISGTIAVFFDGRKTILEEELGIRNEELEMRNDACRQISVEKLHIENCAKVTNWKYFDFGYC